MIARTICLSRDLFLLFLILPSVEAQNLTTEAATMKPAKLVSLKESPTVASSHQTVPTTSVNVTTTASSTNKETITVKTTKQAAPLTTTTPSTTESPPLTIKQTSKQATPNRPHPSTFPQSTSASFPTKPPKTETTGDSKTNHHHITKCEPHPVPVETDPYFSYFPYFVKVYRCHGSIGRHSPSERKCNVKNQVLWTMLLENVSTKKMESITLMNHTECKPEFVVKPEHCSQWQQYNRSTGICDCSHDYFNCSLPHIWMVNQCKCGCGKPPKDCGDQEWSADICECRCPPKVYLRCNAQNNRVDPETCACIPIPARPMLRYSKDPKGRNKVTLHIGFLVSMLVGVCAVTMFFTILFYHCFLSATARRKAGCKAVYKSDDGIILVTPDVIDGSDTIDESPTFDDSKIYV